MDFLNSIEITTLGAAFKWLLVAIVAIMASPFVLMGAILVVVGIGALLFLACIAIEEAWAQRKNRLRAVQLIEARIVKREKLMEAFAYEYTDEQKVLIKAEQIEDQFQLSLLKK